MRRRDGTPSWVTRPSSGSRALTRVDLRPGSGEKGYDEAWLQHLLHENPEILPVEQIEPGFGALIPICRELPLTIGGGRSGSLDNLFLTAEGGLFLVEAKLWRNPEARRSVVAQAMEYAAAVFRLSYGELQAAAMRARSAASEPGESLIALVANKTDQVDEATFIDAVSRNLRRGRAIVAVVGDGIREDIMPLAELLQAQTALIERGVIQIEDSSIGGARIAVRNLALDLVGARGNRKTLQQRAGFQNWGSCCRFEKRSIQRENGSRKDAEDLGLTPCT